MFNLMVCRKSYRKEWDELISKAKCEGITPYNLGKELFQDDYRKIYKKELPICRCLYEDLQEAYNELSKHSLLNELQKTNESVTTETDIETARHNQIDGEIGFEIKPFTLVDERESDEMKKFIKRPAGYTAQQYEILDKVNEGLTEEEIKKELHLYGPQFYHAKRMMVDEDATGVEFEPEENRPAPDAAPKKEKKQEVEQQAKPGNLLTMVIELPVRVINGKKHSDKLDTVVDMLNEGKSLSEIHNQLNLPYGVLGRYMKCIEHFEDKKPLSVEDEEKPINLKQIQLIDTSVEESLTSLEEELEEQFNETLKHDVEKAVEEVEIASNWSIDEWYAPIMVEPPTDKPVPAPVKQSVPMFEWLDDQWIDIGGTCYRMNVGFSIMDGDKHVKFGTSIFIESVENGVKRPYMMSVQQFLRFTESRYSYWIAQTVDRAMYEAHKIRMMNDV